MIFIYVWWSCSNRTSGTMTATNAATPRHPRTAEPVLGLRHRQQLLSLRDMVLLLLVNLLLFLVNLSHHGSPKTLGEMCLKGRH